MKDIALIIDTNSNYSDVWEPCFDRLNRYCNDIKKYAFVDTEKGIPDNITPIIYNNDESYRNQFLSCIKQIKEKYILYSSEDYILYDEVKLDLIHELCDTLDSTNFNFVKLIKGSEKVYHYSGDLFVIDSSDANFFAQQASIWNTRDFEMIFETAPKNNTRMQHEPMGSTICRYLNYNGLQYYANSQKRGRHHYDSSIYPYIATAVVKGRWNLSEYSHELSSVFNEYNIDSNARGVC
tara:strand:- start:267 stop:977 length:711 start_codon:yes stop_codon:yes gene_type:complete